MNSTKIEAEVIVYDNHDFKFVEMLLASHLALKRFTLVIRGECADYVMLPRTLLAIEELEFLANETWEHT